MSEALVWIGVVFCVSQSAMFSGLNLALFTLNPLLLEVEASTGNDAARRALDLRKDSNLALTTVLIGNVAVNVLLTLLSKSVMAGVAAFFFSTVVITAFGEILPQAYFSRNALRVVSYLSPVFRLYRALLFPVAKPVALFLDGLLGREPLRYLKEKELRLMLEHYIEAKEAEIGHTEGQGAINFLSADDLPLCKMGEVLHPLSVISVPFDNFDPVFPDYEPDAEDEFLKSVNASGKKWVVLTAAHDASPRFVLDADGFLRDALMGEHKPDPMVYCHAPILVFNAKEKVGNVLGQWQVHVEHDADHVIDRDVILVWGQEQRIITGADILGRLLIGIAKRLQPNGA